jgi:hypothetical protein
VPRLLPAALVLALLACESTETRGDVSLGTEFSLAPGQSALAGDDGLRVTFVSVVEDSRCPMDAICVWAGQVVIEARAGRDGRDGEARLLKPEESAAVDGFRLTLVRVEPYPASAEPTPPSRYRATFVVDRP